MWVIIWQNTEFYRDSFFLLSFFISYPSSSLNGTHPKPTICSEVSAIWKCMSEIWGIPSPYKSGAQNHLFRPLPNLTATLTVYIFGTTHYIHNRASALETTRGLHRLKMSWTLGVPDMDATSPWNLTYFSRSEISKWTHQILGKIGWHKS